MKISWIETVKKYLNEILVSISIVNLLFGFFLDGINIFKIFLSAFIFFFVPGYFFLSNLEHKTPILRKYEHITLSFGISTILITFFSTYMNYTPLKLTESNITIIITLLICILYFVNIFSKKYSIKPENNFRKKEITTKEVIILALILSVIISFPMKEIIKHDFYLGYDPYLNNPIVTSILSEKLTIEEISKSHQGVGFYYFLASFYSFTSVSIHETTKYGGPVMLGYVSLLLYLLGRRMFKNNVSIFPALLFSTSPWIIRRYMLTIRENFTLIFLIIFIFFFYLFTMEKKIKKNRKLIFILMIILSAIILSHTLVSAILIFALILYFIKNSLERRIDKNLFIILIGGMMLSLPMILLIYHALFSVMGTKEFEGWYRSVNISDFSYNTLFLAVIGIFTFLKKENYNKKFDVLSCIFICSIFFVIISRTLIKYPTFRFIIYTLLAMSFFSVVGLREISKKLKRRTLISIISFLIVSTMFFQGLNIESWSPFEKEDIEESMRLKEIVEKEPGAIIGCYSTRDSLLLNYVDLKNVEVINESELSDINSFNDLLKVFKKKSIENQKIYLFLKKDKEKQKSKIAKIFYMHGELVYSSENSEIWMIDPKKITISQSP